MTGQIAAVAAAVLCLTAGAHADSAGIGFGAGQSMDPLEAFGAARASKAPEAPRIGVASRQPARTLARTVSPAKTNDRAAQARELLVSSGVSVDAVRLYTDLPSNDYNAPNILSVELRANEAYSAAVGIYKILREASGQFHYSWLADKVWEVVHTDLADLHYRNRIPFPGRALEPATAHEVLTRLRQAGLAEVGAYLHPNGAQHPEDTPREFRYASPLSIRRRLGPEGWVLYKHSSDSEFVPATYYAIWHGR